MFAVVANTVLSGMNALKAGLPIGLKAFKYFVDSTFRDKVTPVPGSVLYCDLWVAVEHSGIYLGEGEISNIVVDGLAESTVSRSSPQSFTSKSTLGRKIYVSCDSYGPVGHPSVARGADNHIGERAFYGLVIKNCHQFSTKCVNYADWDYADRSLWNSLLSVIPGETWEPTLGLLKDAARKNWEQPSGVCGIGIRMPNTTRLPSLIGKRTLIFFETSRSMHKALRKSAPNWRPPKLMNKKSPMKTSPNLFFSDLRVSGKRWRIFRKNMRK